MELNFVNGTNLQKSACRTVANNLLNLPAASVPLTLKVEFVTDPEPSLHNEFAYTEYTYGSASATIRISSKLPNWPDPWRGVRFLQEVFAHELGHALFAALPKTVRTTLAQMFGAKSDSLSEINNLDLDWEDRVAEGLAETFKDAFLPRRFRKYANRSRRLLLINRYPEFRQVIRAGLVQGDLVFQAPDGTDAYSSAGEHGDGLYSGSYEVNGATSRYQGSGNYVQLSGSGEPIAGRIERIEASGLVDLYILTLRMTMAWADSFIGGPKTEFKLPPNAGKGYRSISLGDFSQSQKGENFTFSKPVYAYSGKAAELAVRLSFTFGIGGSAKITNQLSWDEPTIETFIEGTPAMMGIETTTPSYPSAGLGFYIFSEIELPISTSIGGLELGPVVVAEGNNSPVPDEADFTTAVGDLFRGAAPAALPTPKVEPTGYLAGAHHKRRLVIG